MKLNKRIIAVCAVVALLLAGVGALAETTMTVQGTGSVFVNADRAGISLGVREVSKDVMTAQSMVNGKIATIVDAMKQMGIGATDISTNSIGIYPNYSYDDGEQITGYTAYNTIYLTVKDVDNTGAYIDAAFAAGANSLDYVEFSAAETDEAAAQALTLAVDSAKEKAQVLADAAGVKLGDILEIREAEQTGYSDYPVYAKNESADTGNGTDVLAARQTVSASISVTFAIAP